MTGTGEASRSFLLGRLEQNRVALAGSSCCFPSLALPLIPSVDSEPAGDVADQGREET